MNRIATLCAALLLSVGRPSIASAQSAPDLFQQALRKERVEGNLKEAIALYQRILKEHAADRTLSARVLVQLGEVYEKQGSVDARSAYQRVVRDYGEQTEQAAVARARLAALSPRAAATRTEPTTRRVWSGADVSREGAPTRDGRYLTFRDQRTGNLGVRDLETGESRLLTDKVPHSPRAFALGSVPSPDGRRIAYTWWPDQGPPELRVIGMDGGESRVLYSNPEAVLVTPKDWSRDGREIVAFIQRKDRSNQIAVINTTDGKLRTLKTSNWASGGKISFSPDGAFIVYSLPPSPDSDQRDVYVLASDGTSESVLEGDAANDVALGWTPDGKYVLFASDRTGNMSLWLAPVHAGRRAGESRIVRRDVDFRVYPMGFTQDGAFFYATEPTTVRMLAASIDAAGKVRGEVSPVLDRVAGDLLTARWSHDGKTLVYASAPQPGPNSHIHMILRSVATGAERILPDLAYFYSPRWSSDDRYLLVRGADQKGRSGIYRVEATTGSATLVVPGNIDVGIAGWSADGQSIIYSTNGLRDHSVDIVIRNLATQETRDVVRVSGARSTDPIASPDGRHVAFFNPDTLRRSAGTLRIVPVAGGAPKDVVRAPLGSAIDSFAWSADGNYIFYMFVAQVEADRKAGKRTSRLMRVPAAGGDATEVGLTMDWASVVQAAGDRLLLRAGNPSAMEIWAMENFLPKEEKPAKDRPR